MTAGTYDRYDGDVVGSAGPRNSWLSRVAPGALALAATTLVGGAIIFQHSQSAPDLRLAASIATSRPAPVNPYGTLAQIRLPQEPDGSWVARSLALDPRPLFAPPSPPPAVVAVAEPPAGAPIAEPAPHVDAVTPLPPRRPSGLGLRASDDAAAPRLAPAPQPSPEVATVEDNRGFLEKLFAGVKPAAPAAPPPPEAKLAYAAPEGETSIIPRFTATNPTSRYDRLTAVYDISARVLYLPDGTKMEAHSGLGNFIDDPNHVNEHAKGATPPNVYALTPREQLFHGVQALRLTPLGSSPLYGRAGLLVHPYMLGPNGDSFGCVSLKDYDQFLQAYQNGQVKKLVVVAKLD